jgi:hypothetical protein
MAFTGVWRSVAPGGLAVPVAYDERFPDCRWDGAGGASDVEDLGSSGGDDPADGAVAGQSLEGCRRDVPVVAALRTYSGNEFGCRPGQFVEVDHNGDVRPDVAGLADLTAVEGPT